MKKIFKLEDLDCANCAAKMEAALAKVDGVEHVSVNFFTQKLTLEAADGDFDEVLKKVVKTAKKVEHDCKISKRGVPDDGKAEENAGKNNSIGCADRCRLGSG